MRHFFHDERGSIVPMYALTLGVIAILMASILDHGLRYLEDRKMQALADLIALMAVRDQDYSTEFARQVIADQGLNAARYQPILTTGRYTPDPDLAPQDRFHPATSRINAVRVDLHARLINEDGETRISRLLAEAAAARRDTASFAIGSRLARVEGGVTGDLLAALIGYDGRIDAMDYEALADVRIDSLSFLNLVAAETRLQALTYEQLLATDIPPGAVLSAVRQLSGDDGPSILDRLAGRALQNLPPIRLGDLFSAEAITRMPYLDGPLGTEMSALDLIEATAYAANSEHQLALDLDAGLAALSLAIGERPQSPPMGAASYPGAVAETRQLHLLTQTRLGLADVDVRLEAAQANAELTRLSCRSNGRIDARFDVETRPARLVVESRTSRRPLLSVDLGSGRRQHVRMNQTHIANGTPATASSGVGVNASALGLSLRSDGLLGGLVEQFTSLTEELGLHLAEADLFLRGASCGHPFLIE
ncbi:hypothetical protein AWH62_02920 [Maricaulis sp. W15]|uniref:hypothetical protein n=1 Tax=Maricaulis sp. W15 TaxID=1772333 RepID=UPI000948BFDE|nr:hypothetical protein [Maricaulis sp. W15]OLF77641.1 hypothetical protein AWH62_02920 [Maricaulis sp. W15]